jgi:hypothetical protein
MELQSCPFHGGAKRTGEFGGITTDIRGLIDGFDTAGFDPRKIEQRVHQLQQTQRVAMNYGELFSFGSGEAPV